MKSGIAESLKAEALMLKSDERLLVKDSMSIDEVGENLKWVRSTRKKWVEMKKKILDPIRSAEKEVRNFFKPIEDMLSDADTRLSKRLAELEAKKKESVKELQAAAEFADTDEEKLQLYAAASAESVKGADGVIMREQWYAEVVDVSKLPREYMMPDMVKLNAAARRLKEAFDVPGARAVKREVTVVRN